MHYYYYYFNFIIIIIIIIFIIFILDKFQFISIQTNNTHYINKESCAMLNISFHFQFSTIHYNHLYYCMVIWVYL